MTRLTAPNLAGSHRIPRQRAGGDIVDREIRAPSHNTRITVYDNRTRYNSAVLKSRIAYQASRNSVLGNPARNGFTALPWLQTESSKPEPPGSADFVSGGVAA